MATPDTGAIAFSDVANETGLTTPNLMSDFYDIANVAGGGGLMYHNLNMATGNATTAKVAIWDQYNSGTNPSGPRSNFYRVSVGCFCLRYRRSRTKHHQNNLRTRWILGIWTSGSSANSIHSHQSMRRQWIRNSV
jgi:hypothetical protein